jgi:hypothetical protein
MVSLPLQTSHLLSHLSTAPHSTLGPDYRRRFFGASDDSLRGADGFCPLGSTGSEEGLEDEEEAEDRNAEAVVRWTVMEEAVELALEAQVMAEAAKVGARMEQGSMEALLAEITLEEISSGLNARGTQCGCSGPWMPHLCLPPYPPDPLTVAPSLRFSQPVIAISHKHTDEQSCATWRQYVRTQTQTQTSPNSNLYSNPNPNSTPVPDSTQLSPFSPIPRQPLRMGEVQQRQGGSCADHGDRRTVFHQQQHNLQAR